MNTNEVIKKSVEIERDRTELKNKLKKINEIYSNIVTNCPHELVIKYNDNQPRKMVIDGHYFCPACGKNIECIAKYQYLSTEFKDSRIIDLNSLSLVGTTEVLKKIREEVINNRDFYYKCKDSIEIKNRMEDSLFDYQHDYKKDKKRFFKAIEHKK